MKLTIAWRDQLTPDAKLLIQRVRRPRSILMPAGRKLASLLRRHFREKNGTPNRLGGERTQYWAQASRSVGAPTPAGETAVQVVISQPGVGLHYAGGTVRPRRARALALPLRAEAHGIPARDWNNRHPDRPLFRPKGRPFLAIRDGRALRVMYLLRRSATIPKDPDTLPSPTYLGRELAATISSRLTNLHDRNLL